MGLAEFDAGTGEHLAQTGQGVFERLANFGAGRAEHGVRLVTADFEPDLDRSEMRRVERNLRLLHLVTREPDDALTEVL